MPDEEITPPTKVKFVFRKSDDYQQCFVNGAYGGFTPHGDLVCDFFFEFKEMPTEQEANIYAGSDKLEYIAGETPDAIKFIREVKLGVIMSPQKVIDLRNWLDKKIEEQQGKFAVEAETCRQK